MIDDFNNEDSTKLKTEMAPKMFDKVDFEDEPINFSSKGWIIVQNNDSNIMTLWNPLIHLIFRFNLLTLCFWCLSYFRVDSLIYYLKIRFNWTKELIKDI